jgi:uncharacterized protein (TIGR02145 family)
VLAISITFSALPGGYGYPGECFIYVGEQGGWWSAIEELSDRTYVRGMSYNNEGTDYGDGDKSSLFSVRCVKD